MMIYEYPIICLLCEPENITESISPSVQQEPNNTVPIPQNNTVPIPKLPPLIVEPVEPTSMGNTSMGNIQQFTSPKLPTKSISLPKITVLGFSKSFPFYIPVDGIVSTC